MENKNKLINKLRNDLPASIVVFLVAMPLCLGIALASGAPLFSGIIAGIVGGIVVASISKSPLGVSGPAAGLAVIVLSAIQELGAYETFLLAVVIAGVIQIALGIMKAGIIGYYFPSSVIKGMLTGIGIIIILKQIPYAFGFEGGDVGFGNIRQLFDFITPGALIIAAVSMGILILWEQSFMKKIPVFKIIQGPLVAVISGILLYLGFQSSETLALDARHLVSIPVAGSLTGFISQFTLPDFSQFLNPQVYIIAVTIAIVASLETLLCVEATDKLDPQKRVTPTNRELLAQGIGNMASGMIGGLPITQVIVRSSANIQSGGKTRMSAFIHGILLLITAMLIPNVLNLIPLASLAAILFVVGFKLAKPVLFVQMYSKGRYEFIPFMVTILGIIFFDLLIGIGLGMAIAVFHILWNNYKTPYHFEEKDFVKGEKLRLQLSEDVSFLNKANIMRTLNHLPDGSSIVIDAKKTKNIHPDILEIIEDFKLNAMTRKVEIEVLGLEKAEKGEKDPVEHFGDVVLDKPMKKTKLASFLNL